MDGTEKAKHSTGDHAVYVPTRPPMTEAGALVPYKYAIAALEPESISEMISLLPGGKLRVTDLTMVKIPAGGGLAWSVLDETGTARPMTEIVGVIVGLDEGRAWWSNPYGGAGGKQPPDCSSPDAIHGHGVRFEGDDPKAVHSCATCPHSQWGSKKMPNGKPSRAQACSNKVRIQIFEPDSILPTIVVAAPTSIAPVRSYLTNAVLKKNRRPTSVVTALRLRATMNADGVEYSVIAPAMVGTLSEEESQAIKERIPALVAALRAAPASDWLQDRENGEGTNEAE